MLVKFKNNHFPRGREWDHKDVPIWPGSPNQPSTTTTAAPLQVELLLVRIWLGVLMKVFLSAEESAEAENTPDGLACRRLASTCSQRASWDWNSMSALASRIEVPHALGND